MSKKPLNEDTGDESHAISSNDQEEAGVLNDSRFAKDATREQRAKAARDQAVVKQFRENLSNNIRLFRAREKWTQNDLASVIGATQPQIAFLERKKQNVSLRILTKLAFAFNVEPMVLLSPLDEGDEIFRKNKTVKVSLEETWFGSSLVGLLEMPPTQDPPLKRPSTQDAVRLTPEEAFFGSKTPAVISSTRSVESVPGAETVLGSVNDPVTLAGAARILSAALKRIEVLRHKHGSVPMTRAMLNSVLAAVLNASHDADDEGADENSSQPEVER